MRTPFDLAYFSTSGRSRPSTPFVGSAPLYGTMGPPYHAVSPTPSSERYGMPAPGAEVDVVLGRNRVQPRLEVHLILVEPVPPRERRLPGLDPRGVLDRTRLAQCEDDVGLDQPPDAVAEHHHPPRRAVRHRVPDGHAGFLRQRRQAGRERSATGGCEVQPGVLVDVRLGDRGPRSAGAFEQQREAEQPVLGQLLGRLRLVTLLVGGGEPVERQGERPGVGRDAELRAFLLDDECVPPVLLREGVAERHAVVTGAEVDIPSPLRASGFPQGHRDLAGIDAHRPPLSRDLGELVPD